MSQKVAGGTAIARENVALAIKMSGESKRAFEFIQAAIKALADAVDDLDARLDRSR